MEVGQLNSVWCTHEGICGWHSEWHCSRTNPTPASLACLHTWDEESLSQMWSAICSNIEHTVSIGSTVGSSSWPEHAWLLTSVRLQGVIRHCRGPLHLPPHLHKLGCTGDHKPPLPRKALSGHWRPAGRAQPERVAGHQLCFYQRILILHECAVCLPVVKTDLTLLRPPASTVTLEPTTTHPKQPEFDTHADECSCERWEEKRKQQTTCLSVQLSRTPIWLSSWWISKPCIAVRDV